LIEVPTRDKRWHEFWIAAEHRGDEPARVAATVQTLDGLIEAVGTRLDMATTVAPAIEALGSGAGVVFRPVPGLAPLDFWVARREDDDRDEVLAFVTATTTALRAG
jgi:hypothetical protein